MAKRTTKRSASLFIKLSAATVAALLSSGADAQTLNCFDNLIYGQIMTCGTPGTVTVRPDGSMTSSCVSALGPTTRARCIVTQSFPYKPMQIQISPTTTAINNGGSTMSVTDFNIISNANGPTATRTTPFVSVPIGATLNVGGTQAGGTYNGSFTISVVFQ
ncbi:MAG: DUF4402 domain-containing protein [Alphaproteobacteria bacterium]|nr:DUF4402 domain-containing protein [Alphaproteobacteria bacterium]